MQTPNIHTFHIPVMGLAYTVDSPIKVARYGIDSVISIIEDRLIELMRKHYYGVTQQPYVPIADHEPDYRARRITDYLNLVNRMVQEQMELLRRAAFEPGSDIAKYFDMLPDTNPLRAVYEKMVASDDIVEKKNLEQHLRHQLRPGRIDVNIMTKVDKNNCDDAGNPVAESSDALAALRGYANSDLTHSSVVFSAGLNPRLFNYLEKLPAFNARGYGEFDKEVVIKVSDYRSALIQGKYLAKKGIWVSEFRIESGLNCGGHAFATDGTLLGPILEEFKTQHAALAQALHQLYKPAAASKGMPTFEQPHPIRITAQGGIGTYEEATFLLKHYQLDSTGWGTPFLLCPEATTVDAHTLELMCKAGEQDIVLSKASPLGVRFNYLKGTTAEAERQSRIQHSKPGSPCTEKHLISNTEFTNEPICTASRAYQRRKIAQLQSLNLTPAEYNRQLQEVVSKECLCMGLTNAAIIAYDLPPVKHSKAVTVCPGPNLGYFDKVASLKDMTDHIYGRTNLITTPNRPHMFIKELILNIKYLEERILDITEGDTKTAKDLLDFSRNLLKGIAYYRELLPKMPCDAIRFEEELTSCEREIQALIHKLDHVVHDHTDTLTHTHPV